ncbi:MAG: hypothetical protein V1663_04030 [archaeon]
MSNNTILTKIERENCWCTNCEHWSKGIQTPECDKCFDVVGGLCEEEEED